jgi:hypothetical protein
MKNNKKECLHKFYSVYYGSEWEVECEKCDKNIYDLYNKEDANKIISDLLLIDNHKKYSIHTTGTAQESIDDDMFLNPKTKQQEEVEVYLFYFVLTLIIAAILWKILK